MAPVIVTAPSSRETISDILTLSEDHAWSGYWREAGACHCSFLVCDGYLFLAVFTLASCIQTSTLRSFHFNSAQYCQSLSLLPSTSTSTSQYQPSSSTVTTLQTFFPTSSPSFTATILPLIISNTSRKHCCNNRHNGQECRQQNLPARH